jgi:hypothetical protein
VTGPPGGGDRERGEGWDGNGIGHDVRDDDDDGRTSVVGGG